ncbi:uncharacterized protein LODBEIA_P44680 [Lodderomyces beijingensis]|uniref:Alpha-1,2-mannosyltransferase n=1 Tax=Lodderomyces beijingensis TaxID=1775926 RepID=A0ABP0ZQ22_9ASCO
MIGSKIKPTQAILLGLSILTLLNVYFAFRSSYSPYSSKYQSGSSAKPASKNTLLQDFGFFSSSSSKSSSSPLKNRGYSVVGYHHDDESSLVVVQKAYHNEHMAEDRADHLWNFFTGDLKSNNYDLKLIEGYNYESYIKTESQLLSSSLSRSFHDHFRTEMKFAHAFKKFFGDLVATIEQSSPNISPINNDEHYPNGAKLEKYYEVAKQLTPESMKYVNPDKLIHYRGRIPANGGHLREYYINELVRSKELLSMYLTLNQLEVDSLKKNHAKFLKLMMKEWPAPLLELNTFNDFMKGDGIVYLAGGKVDQVVFLSIKLMRDHGSRLPIEVILPKKEDYDAEFCGRILPTLNARCKIMTDYIPQSYLDNAMKNVEKCKKNSDPESQKYPYKALSYQMRSLAILISSFERVLYLDADILPLRNPDPLFENKPFTSHHMVVWPDFWRRSTSPHFYDIADIATDPSHRERSSYTRGDPRGLGKTEAEVSFHDTKGTIPEASSDAGQLLINKRVHFKTLVLASYYNYHGPDFYYPLLSQGASGESDKETLIAAAHKLELPYYQVSEFAREFGPVHKNSKKHEFYGIGQYDPIIDYIQANPNDPDYPNQTPTNKKKKPVVFEYGTDPPAGFALDSEDKKLSSYNYHQFKSSSLFFLRASWPKLYIESLFLEDDKGPVDKLSRNRRRLYGESLRKELGREYDFELKMADQLWACYCESPMINMNDIPPPGSDKRTQICQHVDLQRKFLKTGA